MWELGVENIVREDLPDKVTTSAEKNLKEAKELVGTADLQDEHSKEKMQLGRQILQVSLVCLKSNRENMVSREGNSGSVT